MCTFAMVFLVVLHFTDHSSTSKYSIVSFTEHQLFVITGRTLSSLYVLFAACFNPFLIFIWLVVGREGYGLSLLDKNKSSWVLNNLALQSLSLLFIYHSLHQIRPPPPRHTTSCSQCFLLCPTF